MSLAMARTLAAILLVGTLSVWASPAVANPQPPLIQVSAGLGLALADNPYDAGGSGFYAAGEYVLRPTIWFTPRAYVGLLLVSPDADCPVGVSPCEVSSRIGFLGSKVRLMAPIPYIGPFVELGLGASLGRITTRVGSTLDASRRGVTYHIPWAVGIALGRHYQFELSFQYLEHPEEKQTSGAAALGISFPLG